MESYSERISEAGETENRIYWRSYVLARIKVEDYQKLVTAAFNNTKKQVDANASAKELAKEVENRFFEIQDSKY
jgi:hypothetical protein